MMLDVLFSPGEGWPYWLIIAGGIIALIVKFLGGGIKSTIELVLKGKQSVTDKKVDHTLEIEKQKIDQETKISENERGRLIKKIEALEEENKLIKKQLMKQVRYSTSLANIVSLIVDEYEESNPKRKTIVERMRTLLLEDIAL